MSPLELGVVQLLDNPFHIIGGLKLDNTGAVSEDIGESGHSSNCSHVILEVPPIAAGRKVLD